MKVKFEKDSFYVVWQHAKPNYLVKGTKCTIYSDEVETAIIAIGESRCHSSDVFSKKRGRVLSLKKALKAAGFGKQKRVFFWIAYENMINAKW